MKTILLSIILACTWLMSCENDTVLEQQECKICGTWISNEAIPIDGEYATIMNPLIELHIFDDDSVYVFGEMKYSGRGLEDSFLTSMLSGKRVPILEFQFEKKYIDARTYDCPTVVIRGLVDGDDMCLDLREYLIDSRAREILKDPDGYSVSPYLIDINNNLGLFNSVHFIKQ